MIRVQVHDGAGPAEAHVWLRTAPPPRPPHLQGLHLDTYAAVLLALILPQASPGRRMSLTTQGLHLAYLPIFCLYFLAYTLPIFALHT